MTGERTDVRPARGDDELVFHDNHRPRVEFGDYTITATQTLTARVGESLEPPAASIRLRVSGPQLALPPGSVLATFPADLSAGSFSTTLPHVTLSRGLLPWERRPHLAATGEPAPWMVLLVLSADEFAAAKLTQTKAAAVPPEIRSADSHPDADVTLLEFDSTLLATHLPSLVDLPWTAHVRSIVTASGDSSEETATVVSSRLAAPGVRNHAFLLGVEGRYGQTAISATTAKVRFPVLHQFSFFCQAEHAHGFVELLTETDGVHNTPAGFALAATPDDVPESASRIAAGFVPMRHMLRNGDASAAWYHGPLLPAPLETSVDGVATHLPADQSDDLLVLDSEFAMFDVSYAAAWELGRMIALEHTDIATSIYRWKRSFAHVVHRNAQDAGVATLHGQTIDEPLPPMPDPVAKWIESSLLELREVPFRYLVADRTMLPTTAFRFFAVDPRWLECLRDGALSVGRTDSRARELELQMRAHLGVPRTMSGFLLRSGAVSDFPDLEINGYAGTPPEPGVFDGVSLPVLRMDRIAPSVLLVIFDGVVTTVDVHLHPQAIHFGFGLGDGSTPEREIYEKQLAGSAPVRIGFVDPAATTPTGVNSSRRVDLHALAARLSITEPVGAGGVAAFAAAMLEGVPLVRFARDVGGAL